MAGRSLPQLRCDNFEVCGSMRLTTEGRDKEFDKARVKGWHIFDGETYGGKRLMSVLCDKCVGTSRSRPLSTTEPLKNDQTLF